ncbi:Protein YLS9 [Carex littledalei]|uniref:Protein YLS9 n=1 Tax=Carex littledalei TaxID=544730 RepID=A0A833V684_9POAL|nr:Protein YLS9 [Carex littledalei]
MAYNTGNPVPPPPRYVMLAEQGGSESMNLRPPPTSRNLPRYHTEKSKGNGCCKCFCWCFCFLFLLILAIAAALAYLFYIYKPQIPSYSVTNFSVGSFEFRPSEFTMHTKLFVSVRAENPNEMIGIKYGEASSVVVSYRNSTLSSGKLPNFYQGHKNVTVMQVTLEGVHPYGSGLQKAIEESSDSGSVPLDVYVRVPFSLKLDTLDLREVTVNVHCALVVDSISPKKKPNIKSATYDVNVEF